MCGAPGCYFNRDSFFYASMPSTLNQTWTIAVWSQDFNANGVLFSIIVSSNQSRLNLLEQSISKSTLLLLVLCSLIPQAQLASSHLRGIMPGTDGVSSSSTLTPHSTKLVWLPTFRILGWFKPQYLQPSTSPLTLLDI